MLSDFELHDYCNSGNGGSINENLVLKCGRKKIAVVAQTCPGLEEGRAWLISLVKFFLPV